MIDGHPTTVRGHQVMIDGHPTTSRRTLIAAASATALLSACGTTAPSLQTDLDLLSAFARAAGPVLTAVAPGQATTIDTAVNYIVSTDAALSGMISTTTPNSTVSGIVSGVEALAPLALSLLPSGSAVVLAAQAALALVPELLSAAGVSAPPTAATGPGGMTAAQARVVLRGLPR
jgi:hypothetical protein